MCSFFQELNKNVILFFITSHEFFIYQKNSVLNDFCN